MDGKAKGRLSADAGVNEHVVVDSVVCLNLGIDLFVRAQAEAATWPGDRQRSSAMRRSVMPASAALKQRTERTSPMPAADART